MKIVVGIISLIVILGVVIFYSSFRNINKELYDTKEINKNLTEEKLKLTEEISSLNTEIDDLSKTYNCEYTVTLMYNDLISKTEEGTNYHYFTLFQSYDPIIIKTDTVYELDKNIYYEITVKGIENQNTNFYHNTLSYEIVNISKSMKSGLDQVQEVCEKN